MLKSYLARCEPSLGDEDHELYIIAKNPKRNTATLIENTQHITELTEDDALFCILCWKDDDNTISGDKPVAHNGKTYFIDGSPLSKEFATALEKSFQCSYLTGTEVILSSCHPYVFKINARKNIIWNTNTPAAAVPVVRGYQGKVTETEKKELVNPPQDADWMLQSIELPATDDQDRFSVLPTEVLTSLLMSDCIEVKDIGRLARVCRAFANLANDETIWRHQLSKDYVLAGKLPDKTWKQSYQLESSLRWNSLLIPDASEGFSTFSFSSNDRVVTLKKEGEEGEATVISNRSFSSGVHKIVVEVNRPSTNDHFGIGIVEEDWDCLQQDFGKGGDRYSLLYWSNGEISDIHRDDAIDDRVKAVNPSKSNIITILLDMDNNNITFYADGRFLSEQTVEGTPVWLVASLSKHQSVAIKRWNNTTYDIGEIEALEQMEEEEEEEKDDDSSDISEDEEDDSSYEDEEDDLSDSDSSDEETRPSTKRKNVGSLNKYAKKQK